MLVISPHLDDAVLGCGALLAARPGSTVITVFAGAPRDGGQLTEWDARCGFASADDAMRVRRGEDREALSLLSAEPVWLDFCDSQYHETPSLDSLRAALAGLLAERVPQTVLYPMGLYHSDHLLVHDAMHAALQALPDTQAWMYEDALYRGMRGVLQLRLAEFAARGQWATPVRMPPQNGTAKVKAQALRAYASQHRAFGPQGWDDAGQPERFWRLEPAEPAHAD